MIIEPKISIIIPVYNTGKYLPLTLESVKQQTYQNIQIVLVNDCSTDMSDLVIKDFIMMNPLMDIKYISLEKNTGSANARLEALRYVTGDYIHMLDSDDTILPYTYEHALEKIQEEEAEVCFWGWNDVEETGAVSFRYEESFQYLEKSLSGYDACCEKISRRIWICLWNALYAMPLCVRQEPIFFDGLNIGEDHFAVNKLLLAANKVCCVQENNYNYMQRNDSLVHSANSHKRLQGLVLIDMLSDYCNEAEILNAKQKEELSLLLIAEYAARAVILIDATIIDNMNSSVQNTIKVLKARDIMRNTKLPPMKYCGAIKKVHRIKKCLYDVSPSLYVYLYRALLKLKKK